jgi:predicted metal-dependent phosphoesterase TrpH
LKEDRHPRPAFSALIFRVAPLKYPHPMTRRLFILAFALAALARPASESHTAPRALTEARDSVRTLSRLVHFDQPGPKDSRYAYAAFEVPPTAVRLRVSYSYDRAGGANAIDIGLFDARFSGRDDDRRGFRGWSGSRRPEIFISRNQSTPGYTAGSLHAGTWRVIFGLYRVAKTGVDITLTVTVDTGSTAETRPARETKPLTGPSRRGDSTARRWFIGDLHSHTIHSDGNWTVAEIAASARTRGLDFIAVTDHNTISHHRDIDRLPRAPLVLRGAEVTTYGGHANVWGLSSGDWVDFRVRPGDLPRMARVSDEAHKQGALISINHPFALCAGCSWSYDRTAAGFDAIEVWNGEWDATDEQAVKMWDAILKSGRRITAIASSDTHRQADPPARPATHVAARELTQSALLEALREGRVYITSEPASPAIKFLARTIDGHKHYSIGDRILLDHPDRISLIIEVGGAPPDASVVIVGGGERIASLGTDEVKRERRVEVECRADSYFRIEVRNRAGALLGLTNPIYVSIKNKN